MLRCLGDTDARHLFDWQEVITVLRGVNRTGKPSLTTAGIASGSEPGKAAESPLPPVSTVRAQAVAINKRGRGRERRQSGTALLTARGRMDSSERCRCSSHSFPYRAG
jgi:hypothetical protein